MEARDKPPTDASELFKQAKGLAAKDSVCATLHDPTAFQKEASAAEDALSKLISSNTYLLGGCLLVGWELGWKVGIATWLLSVFFKRCS